MLCCVCVCCLCVCVFVCVCVGVVCGCVVCGCVVLWVCGVCVCVGVCVCGCMRVLVVFVVTLTSFCVPHPRLTFSAFCCFRPLQKKSLAHEKRQASVTMPKDAPLPSAPSGSQVPADQIDMVFHCQLAHGSPTKQIRDFTNVKQLYESIAKAFGIPTADVLHVLLEKPKLGRVEK